VPSGNVSFRPLSGLSQPACKWTGVSIRSREYAIIRQSIKPLCKTRGTSSKDAQGFRFHYLLPPCAERMVCSKINHANILSTRTSGNNLRNTRTSPLGVEWNRRSPTSIRNARPFRTSNTCFPTGPFVCTRLCVRMDRARAELS